MLRLRPCLLFLSLAGLVQAGCNQHPASSLQAKQAVVAPGEIGSHLPEFSAKDLQGREISSADLRGKVVLVDFWAPVSAVQKRNARLSETPQPLRLTRIAVIGFKFDTMMDTEDPAQFAKKIGVRYPLAVAPDDLKQKFGGIKGCQQQCL